MAKNKDAVISRMLHTVTDLRVREAAEGEVASRTITDELPVVGISVNKPTMLADCPMLRTYINTYDSNDDTMDALVEALLTKNHLSGDEIDAIFSAHAAK